MIVITRDAIGRKLRREGVIGRKLRREGVNGRKLRREGVNGRKLRREGVNGTPPGGASLRQSAKMHHQLFKNFSNTETFFLIFLIYSDI